MRVCTCLYTHAHTQNATLHHTGCGPYLVDTHSGQAVCACVHQEPRYLSIVSAWRHTRLDSRTLSRKHNREMGKKSNDSEGQPASRRVSSKAEVRWQMSASPPRETPRWELLSLSCPSRCFCLCVPVVPQSRPPPLSGMERRRRTHFVAKSQGRARTLVLSRLRSQLMCAVGR